MILPAKARQRSAVAQPVLPVSGLVVGSDQRTKGINAPAMIRVYLVEDSDILRDRVIESITEPGRIEVVGYTDSEAQAIREIRDFRPDVAIIDIQLRQGNGINVLQQIPRLGLPSLPKRIVLTNYALPEYLSKCVELGADFFFDKSTEFHRIHDVLQQLAEAPR
jgi:DNA-binding NarL/FixJ family response regulator